MRAQNLEKRDLPPFRRGNEVYTDRGRFICSECEVEGAQRQSQFWRSQRQLICRDLETWGMVGREFKENSKYLETT
jgi:hypothetical protein